MRHWYKVEQDIQKLPIDANVLMAFNDGSYNVGRFTLVEIGDYKFLTVERIKSNDYDIVWPDYWMPIPEITE